jgi:hypothetical protein
MGDTSARLTKGYVKESSYIYHVPVSMSVKSVMRIEILEHGTYYIKVEYRVKPDGESYGDWNLARWYSYALSSGMQTYADTLYTAAYDDQVQCRWRIYNSAGSVIINERIETYDLPTS